jgi:predicted glycosyltransferase
VPQWTKNGAYGVLRRFYDEIWVAGVQAIYDPITQYRLPPALVPRVKFCGHVARSTRAEDVEGVRQELRLDGAPLVVVSCGGGGDGYPLVRAYADVVDSFVQRGVHSAVFLGPDMPAEQRRDLKQRLLPLSERVHTYDFRPDLVAFLRLAAVSVSMGGYNTICELMGQRTPSVVVPRAYPRVEQVLRAEAFAARGLLRMIHPEVFSPAALEHEVTAQLSSGLRPTPIEGLDFAGLSRIARRVRKQLAPRESGESGR